MLRERERDVLRLLGTDLSGPDMARALMVSLNTLRTHTKNSYAKREVNTRHAAVRQAEDLDLFSRPRTPHPRPWQVCRTACRGFFAPAPPPDEEITTAITTCGDAVSPHACVSSSEGKAPRPPRGASSR